MRTHARRHRNGYRCHANHNGHNGHSPAHFNKWVNVRRAATAAEIKERQEQVEKIKARIKREEEEVAPQREWLYRCLPRVPFPPIVGRPRLSFGLAAFLIFIRERFIKHGDQDAAAALRVLRPRPWSKTRHGKLLV